jgi:hypothetical protein
MSLFLYIFDDEKRVLMSKHRPILIFLEVGALARLARLLSCTADAAIHIWGFLVAFLQLHNFE